MNSDPPEPDMAVERCRRKIASIEALLRAGHADLEVTARVGGLVRGTAVVAGEQRQQGGTA